jgi:hypothetical protein
VSPPDGSGSGRDLSQAGSRPSNADEGGSVTLYPMDGGPLGLVAHRGVHGFSDRAVEGGAWRVLGYAVGDWVLGPREVQRDAVVVEGAGQVFQPFQARRGEVGHGFGVEHEGRGAGRRAA